MAKFTTSAEIVVAGAPVRVQFFDSQGPRRIFGNIDETPPVPVSAWPITAEQVQKLAQAKLDSVTLRAPPTRADITWAVDTAGLHYDRVEQRWLFCAVKTAKEDRRLRRSALEEARDGLV